MPAKGVRLESELWKRAEALAATLAGQELLRDALGHDPTAQDVLRMAIRRGLSVLEQSVRRDHPIAVVAEQSQPANTLGEPDNDDL